MYLFAFLVHKWFFCIPDSYIRLKWKYALCSAGSERIVTLRTRVWILGEEWKLVRRFIEAGLVLGDHRSDENNFDRPWSRMHRGARFLVPLFPNNLRLIYLRNCEDYYLNNAVLKNKHPYAHCPLISQSTHTKVCRIIKT